MSLARSTLLVGTATALSRLTGFVRDVLIAGALGAGPVADAFLVAFRIPNLIRRVLSEGGLNAGFVPLYARVRAEQGPEAAARFAAEGLAGIGWLLVGLTALVEIAAAGVVLVLAAGYAEDPLTLALAATYTRAAFPFVTGVTLASLLGALLAAERRFAAASLAPLAVNVVLVVTLVIVDLVPGMTAVGRAFWLSVAVGLSGFVHLAIVAASVRRGDVARLRWRPSVPPAARRLLRAGLPALVASGAAQIIILAGTQVASFWPSAVSWLYYADRVFQLPLGFVGSAVGLVLLPEIAARDAAGDRDGFANAKNRAVEASLLVAVPAAAALAILARPIAHILFEHGAFGPVDTRGTAHALAGLALGLPAAAIGKVLSQGLFARNMMSAALLGGLAGVVTAVVAAVALVGPFGVYGIGIGMSLGFTAHALATAAVLVREGLWRPDARLKERTWRIAGATAAMTIAVHAARAVVGPFGAGSGRGALALAALCVLGLAVYAAAVVLLKAVRRDDLAVLTKKA